MMNINIDCALNQTVSFHKAAGWSVKTGILVVLVQHLLYHWSASDISLPLITERDTCLYECVCPQTYWHKCPISCLCSAVQCLFLIKQGPTEWKGQVCFYFLHQLFLFCLLAALRTDDNSAPLDFLCCFFHHYIPISAIYRMYSLLLSCSLL